MRRGLPFFLIEPVAAFVGVVGALAGKDIYGSRARARGWLLTSSLDGKRISIGPRCTFVSQANIELASDITFYGNAYLNAAGERGSIRIGRNTHVDQFCVLYGQGGLTIGSDCAIASAVVIYTQTNQYGHDWEAKIVDQPIEYKEVIVGDDVWIGAGAVILPGVHVGDHAVIGAQALVRENVAAWSIVGGVPAKAIGDRRPKLRSVSDQNLKLK